jgi:hypothetical protein
MDMQLEIVCSLSTDVSLCVCIYMCMYIYIFFYLYVYVIFASLQQEAKKKLVFDVCPFVSYHVAILEKLN